MSYFTTRDDVQLYYKDWGTGRPVVMIHGWPLSSDTFDDLGMSIADAGMRAIAYDRRGFGRSEQPWGGYDYDALTDDLADLLVHTSAHDATLIGFSMGGGEVARYMTRHNGTGVRQAIFLGAIGPCLLKGPKNPDGVDASVFQQMTDAIEADRAAFWTAFFPAFYGVGPGADTVSDAVIDWSRAVAMQASLKATLDCVDAFSRTDFRADLQACRVPTLIIHGTEDKTVPIDVSARRAARDMPGSTLIEYEGAPHGLLASHKNRLAEDVLKFLGRQP